MNEDARQALMELLGERYREDGATVVAEPATERELLELMKVLRARGAAQHDGLRISRRHFASILQVEPKSGTAVAGAGVRVERLEQELRLRDLSLGPLSPGMLALDLAGLLEGPYAGLRAIPGGRLEPTALALTAIMADGLRFVSRPSPRSAAGPDLDALFLGSEGRFGLIVEATLRCFARPRTERAASFSFAEAATAVSALTAAIGAGVWFRRAALAKKGERVQLSVEVIGTAESVERDLSSLGHEVFGRGGRSSGQEPAGPAEAGLADTAAERELSWPDVVRAVSGGDNVSLWRLSLESAIAQGTSMGAPLELGGWANAEPLRAVAREADPSGIFGGVA